MKTICIYHGNCFDGMAAAWVVNRWWISTYLDGPNSIKFIPGFYSDSIHWLFHDRINEGVYTEEDNLIIVDFSFKREVMINLKEIFPKMLVLDHHKTAQAACEGLDFCIFDMNESGASLAWKHYFPNEPLPNLIKYVKDRDLWLFKEPGSEFVNSYIQSFPIEFKSYEQLYNELEASAISDIKMLGEAIERYKQTMVKAMCKNAAVSRHYPFYDNRVPVVNASILFSEVGHELCKMYPDAPFAAYYFDRLKDDVRQWGLRSIGDYDVSEVAKKFGGGGHKNAAGFETKLSEM